MQRLDHDSSTDDEGESAPTGEESPPELERIDVPDDARPAEAAAIVAAVRAHLQDARRAAETSAEDRETVSRWRLQSRLGSGARRLRQPVGRGEVWKAAARTA
jgi:hypothetical protein